MNVREWALPVYTILMQLATGMLFVLWVIRRANLKGMEGAALDRILRRPVLIVFLTTLVGMLGAHFHLSQPLQSFLAVLNLRHSWLSREILFTVLTFFSSALLADLVWYVEGHHRVKTITGWITVLFGSASIYCMSSIYLLPTQSSWNNAVTILMFFGTTLLLGVTAASALLVMDAIFVEGREPELSPLRVELARQALAPFTSMAVLALVVIIACNLYATLLLRNGDALAQISYNLLLGLYGPLLAVRFATLLAGVGVLIMASVWLKRQVKTLTELATPVYLACMLALVAEILGRFLFYATHVRLGP